MPRMSAIVPPLTPANPSNENELPNTRANRDYRVQYARTGMPRAPGAPDWPDHAPEGAFIHFADGAQIARNLLPGMFALHDAVVSRRRVAGDAPWNWNAGVAAPLPESEV